MFKRKNPGKLTVYYVPKIASYRGFMRVYFGENRPWGDKGILPFIQGVNILTV
jgi:hypothetical protein